MATGSPILDQTTWTFQRSCDAVENILDRANYVLHALPSVIAGLREAAPQLEASCVAPPRDWPQENMAYRKMSGCGLE